MKGLEVMAGFNLHSHFWFILKMFLLHPSLALDVADLPLLLETNSFFPWPSTGLVFFFFYHWGYAVFHCPLFYPLFISSQDAAPLCPFLLITFLGHNILIQRASSHLGSDDHGLHSASEHHTNVFDCHWKFPAEYSHTSYSVCLKCKQSNFS